MTRSPLTDDVKHSNKSSSRNGNTVSYIIVHHWAGTRGGVERLVYSNDKASANYIILSDGTIISSVPENRRAWTSGSSWYDSRGITIEVQNSTLSPTWQVSAKAYESLLKLSRDLAKRYPIKQIIGHRDTGAATACPGPYLYPRLPEIRKYAFNTSAPAPKAPANTPKNIDALARDVIAGKYGNGETRKRRLGTAYTAVQQRVNQILAGNASPQTPRVNIDKLAREVIAGKYGNGAARKRALGGNYQAVQNRVNQILRG